MTLPMTPADAFQSARRYDKRLALVVPYRDRTDHLRQFLEHVTTYFERDKLDRQIPVSIHVVEQQGEAPFNRGKIKNCGYALVSDRADYVCFHDVDYLPIWADYAWSPRPARLIWHGLTRKEDPETFCGGAVLFDNEAFERVNGYPNAYWGWAPEDLELGLRARMAGLGFDCRDGTYTALPHPHAGFASPGVHSEEAQRTHAVWNERQGRMQEFMEKDGLSSLDFKLVRAARIALDDKQVPNAFYYLVDIGAPEPT